MTRRLIAGTWVVVMCGGIAIRAQTPATHYLFGSVDIVIPAPEHYVAFSSDDLKLRESLAGRMGGGEALASFVPATSAQSLSLRQTGQSQERESWATLSTSPDVRAIDVGADDFRAMAMRVRTGLADVSQRVGPDLASAATEIGRRMQTDVGLQLPTVVGVFDDAVNRIGVLLVTPVSLGGSTTAVLSASTIIRVRSRVLFANVYSPDVDAERLTALVTLARSWTDAILDANGEAPPRGQGRVDVSTQPLRPDPARLKELGLELADVEAPTAVEKPTPTYPEGARQAGIQGSVSLRCVIETTGKVAQCEVTQSLTPELDAAAIAGVSRWAYAPAKVKGKAVPAYVAITVSYQSDRGPER